MDFCSMRLNQKKKNKRLINSEFIESSDSCLCFVLCQRMKFLNFKNHCCLQTLKASLKEVNF